MKNQAVNKYYQVIGRKGGEATKKRYGKGVFKLFGKKGGRPKKPIDKKSNEAIIEINKVNVRQKLRYAVSVGKIKKLACNECGDVNSHAHHPDYSRPYEVIWLCRHHHVDLHEKLLNI